MRNQRIYRIAVVGPESTGKSVLAEQLASHYNTVWVSEYSRKYLPKLERAYNYNDILIIARAQFLNEQELLKEAEVTASAYHMDIDKQEVIIRIFFP